MTDKPLKVNPIILRKCREQLKLSIEEAEKKLRFKNLAQMEEEGKRPTYNQLNKLAEVYLVGPGLFFHKGNQLPEECNFDRLIPKYRIVASGQKPQDSFHRRQLLVNVMHLREFILELYEDIEPEISSFSPPKSARLGSIEAAAEVAPKIRAWLGFGANDIPTFDQWRRAIEDKGVFVFMTSRYNHWSKTAIEDCRGLALNLSPLPIIVINDSDSYRAQLFTLMHELGHLLYGGGNILDSGDDLSHASWGKDQFFSNQDIKEEKICNRFAAEILAPSAALLKQLPDDFSESPIEGKWKTSQQIAKKFNVSALMISYRTVTLNKMTEGDSIKIRRLIQEQYKNKPVPSKDTKIKKNVPTRSKGMNTNVPKRVLRQYGSIYVMGLLDAYYAKEMTLHRLCQNLSFNSTEYVKEMESLL